MADGDRHDALFDEAQRFVKAFGAVFLDSLPLAGRRAMVDGVWHGAATRAAEGGTPFSCRGSGCWGCCRGKVALSAGEAADILPRLGPEVFARALASRDEDEERVICPALDPETKRCSIYEHRPLTCRAMSAVTPAEDCYPENGVKTVAQAVQPIAAVGAFCALDGIAERAPWTTLRAEIVAVALFNADP